MRKTHLIESWKNRPNKIVLSPAQTGVIKFFAPARETLAEANKFVASDLTKDVLQRIIRPQAIGINFVKQSGSVSWDTCGFWLLIAQFSESNVECRNVHHLTLTARSIFMTYRNLSRQLER